MLHFSRAGEKMDRTKVNIETIFPVYISMTTIPSRMKNTIKIIKNFLNNVSGNYTLILNVCENYRKVTKSDITKNIEELQQINSPKFRLNVTYDIGPITKIVPSLKITPNECIIIICDDNCYHHEAFKILAEKQDKVHNKTFTFWKYLYSDVEVPQGVDLISFWKPNLQGFEKYYQKSTQEEKCFFVDDLVIGFFLKEKGIPIVQVERKWKWPWIHPCFDEKESLNTKKGQNSRKNTMKKCFLHLI